MISETATFSKETIDPVLLSCVEEVAAIPADLPVPKEIRERIFNHLGFSSEIEATILISGIQPGTGSSTLKRLLCRVLGYPDNPDAGFYRRAIAHYWADTLANGTQPLGEKPEHDEWIRMQWEKFEQFIKNQTDLFVEFIRSEVNPKKLPDEELIPFNSAQDKFSLDTDFWENLPDDIVRKQILGDIDETTDDGYESGVWQGKFTSIVDWIVNQDFEGKDHVSFAHPLIRLLLTIDPLEAAKRVAVREGWTLEKALAENALRRTRDEDVLKNIYGKDFSIFDDPRILHMDTTDLTPAQEVALVLDRLSKRKRA